MNVTYQKELFIKIMAELPPLILRHYAEVQIEERGEEVDLAWQRYVDMELAGALHILTVRADAKLIGYYFNMVYPHLRHKTRLCAWSDVFFVLPEYRRTTRAGIKIFTENEKMLREIGVKKNFIIAKDHIDLTQIMKFLKYTFIERIFSRWL